MIARRLSRGLSLAVLISWSVIALADGSSGSGAVSITNTDPIVQNFDTLANTGNSNALPAGWYLTELGGGTAANGFYTAGTGSSTTGDTYSFGPAGSTERALGSLGSGSITSIFYGAKFVNNSTGPITSLSISFAGEMWRRGTSAADGLTFSYSTSATAVNAADFTDFPALNFPSLTTSCSSSTATATDGNSAACRSAISAVITGLSINPGGFIWIRWKDVDSAGSDDSCFHARRIPGPVLTTARDR